MRNMLKLLIIAVLILIVTMLLSGCTTTKVLRTEAVPVMTTQADSFTHMQLHQDTVMIERWHYLDRTNDTVYEKEAVVEYRYKLRCDTVMITKTDSIPYPVTITEIREKPVIPPRYIWMAVVGFVSIIVICCFVLKH